MPMPNFPHIPPFRPFIPPMSLPAVYGDELSYMELLAKVEKWLSDLVESNNLQNAAIVALYAAWEDFKNGGYTESFEEFLDQWFADNQEHIDELLTGQFADELAAIQETADGAVQTATEAEQAVAGKVNLPTGGTNGQVLSKAATDTGTQWVDPIIPTDQQAETYITQWLNEHPDATTTVMDGSITVSKLGASSRAYWQVPETALDGGSFHPPYLELGGFHTDEDGLIAPSVYSTRARTPLDMPLLLPYGTTLACSEGYKTLYRRVSVTPGGLTNYYDSPISPEFDNTHVIPVSGLYLILVSPNDESVTTAQDCIDALTITIPEQWFLSELDTTFSVNGVPADSSGVGATLISSLARRGKNCTFIPPLEQGSFSFSQDGYTPSSNSRRCRTPINQPMWLCAGDVMHIDEGFVINISECAVSESTLTLVKRYGTQTTAFYVPRSGLYAMVTYTEDSSIITPDDAMGAISVSSYAVSGPSGNFPILAEFEPSYGVQTTKFELLEQGSFNFTDGYIHTSDTSLRCRMISPIRATRGDRISVSNELILNMSRVFVLDGLVWRANSGSYETVSGASYVFEEDALYVFVVSRVDGTALTPSIAKEGVTFTSTVPVEPYHIPNYNHLAKNPYFNVPWDNMKQVTSVSHVHCETQAQFNDLKNKYDHLAISNYHPSIPCYPIEQSFEGVVNLLQSPNSEHPYFLHESTHLHMNALGSLLVSVSDNPRNETVTDFTRRVRESTNGFGGITINHPRWSGITAAHIIGMLKHENVFALEVWNASCERSNGTGDSSDIWDGVLSRGIQIFATAVPDHEIQYHPDETQYGFGYNHMIVSNRTADEVMYAYMSGRFYTTTRNDGLTLSSVSISADGLLSIEVSEASTYLFKTATRSIAVSSAATSATFQTQDGDIYVRVEVSRGDNKLWTNAIMLI